MPDILSQGGDRESGPWPRRIAVAAALALVAAAIAYYLPRSRHETAQPARPTATATAVPGPVSQGFSGDQGVAAEPDGITGQTSLWPGGLRLPATGQQPMWFYPATGQAALAGRPGRRSPCRPVT